MTLTSQTKLQASSSNVKAFRGSPNFQGMLCGSSLTRTSSAAARFQNVLCKAWSSVSCPSRWNCRSPAVCAVSVGGAYVGSVIGCILATFLAKTFGPSRIMFWHTAPNALGWTLQVSQRPPPPLTHTYTQGNCNREKISNAFF